MKEERETREPGNSKEYRLFLLRLWHQDGGWRGRLLDLASGDAYSFAGWQELTAVLLGGPVHVQIGLCAQEDSDVHPET